MKTRKIFLTLVSLSIIAGSALAFVHPSGPDALASPQRPEPPAADTNSLFLTGQFPVSTDATTRPFLQEGFVVVRAYFDDPALVATLAGWLEPWEVDYRKGFLVAGVNPTQYQILEEMGFRLEIDEAMTAQIQQLGTPLPGQVNGIPGYPCYRTVEETYSTAQQIALDHPDLAEWIDIGDSWELTNKTGGYDLLVLKLTNSQITLPKPKLFVMSAIHAREYATAELNLRFAEYLVENYGSDPDATWLLDYHEVHLLLQSNPDGRKKAETGILWRKNTNNNYCSNTNNRGADLNRNFEFLWGCCGGSSGNECSETYRGPSPASEPETQAVQNYVRSIFPDQRGDGLGDPAPPDATGVFLDLHSYSELVLWPWGFTAQVAPNSTALQTLGRKFAFFNGYEPSQAITLYPTDGTTDDFAYGDLGLAAYTFEVGTSFFQSCGFFESDILPGNLPALIYAAKTARTPYLTPSGPDTTNLGLSGSAVAVGTPITMTAITNDTRYNNQNGSEPTQNIAAAEYYIDVPPWDSAGSPTAYPMSPTDGSFNSRIEAVEAMIDTTQLQPGRHILYVRGLDTAGNWGVFSAAFLYIIDPETAPRIRGQVTAADTGLPLQASVSAGTIFETTSSPENGLYSMYTISGTYQMRAQEDTPGVYAPAIAANVPAQDGQLITQDFSLYPQCSAFTEDVEAGNTGWSADTPWAITTENSHSPTHSWTDSPGGSYGNNRNISLTSPVIDLSTFESVQLEFWQICDTEATYDFCHVEVSADGGTSWTEIAAFDGSHSQWQHVELPLPGLDDQPQTRLRFRLTTDGSVTRDGWHIDDIRIVGGSPECISPLLPAEASFLAPGSLPLGSTAVFTNTSTGSLLGFNWDFGDGTPTSSERNPRHAYQQAGQYTVTLSASNELGSDAYTQTLQIINPFDFSYALSKSASLTETLPGETYTYTLDLQIIPTGTHSANLSLTDVLPTQVELVTDTLSLNGSPALQLYDPSSRQVTLPISETLVETYTASLVYSVRVSEEVLSGTLVVNNAVLDGFVDGEAIEANAAVQVLVLRPEPPPVDDGEKLYLPFIERRTSQAELIKTHTRPAQARLR